MGILDNINFQIPISQSSSFDFRLLDLPCNHVLRNERVVANLTSLVNGQSIIAPTVYSGNSVVYNNSVFNGIINPDGYIFLQTKYPYVNDGSLTIYQYIDPNQILEEEFIVVDPISTTFQLQFPPRTGSVKARQISVNENGDTIFSNFENYTLAELYGQITFNVESDVGTSVIFSYLPAKSKILPKSKNRLLNYEFVGFGAKQIGIIKLYGRAVINPTSSFLFKYTTTLNSCIKCSSRGVLNDVGFTSNGRIQLVYDFSKLIQDFFKRFNTQRGSDALNPNIGTDVTRLIGIAKSDGVLAEAFIRNEVVNLLYGIRNKQLTQVGLQSISPGEQIAQINRVDVRALNATDFDVRIEVLSKSGLTQQLKSKVTIRSDKQG